MRIFTAIPLPKEVKDNVSSITRGRLPVPYINTTNLHITLNFFGELDSDQVKKVREIFEETTAGYKKFKVEFGEITKFHHQLHLTLKFNPKLLKLHEDLEKAFMKLGFTFQNRDFYPHVKLANLHMDNVMNRQRKMENFPHAEFEQLNFTADKIVLYESKLLLHHPQYIPLLEQQLQ